MRTIEGRVDSRPRTSCENRQSKDGKGREHSQRRDNGLFFFQAEDGIRDVAVTGVQTCALPISDWGGPVGLEERAPSVAHDPHFREWWATYLRMGASPGAAVALTQMNSEIDAREEIGRASCRERV